MSRIGKLSIQIPASVQVEITDGGRFAFKQVKVTGPKGTLTESIQKGVTLKKEEDKIIVERDSDSKQNRSFHGLYRSLINNMILGVTEGYRKDLEIVGIGYRAEVQGQSVVFSLGYSHKITFTPPEGISIKVEEQTKVAVEGADKQLVGEVAAKIRQFRKPEPYKGKGVRYKGENVRRKSAKSAGA